MYAFVDLNKVPYPTAQTISLLPQFHPYSPEKGQVFQLELGRGCPHKCNFCLVGRLLNKGR